MEAGPSRFLAERRLAEQSGALVALRAESRCAPRQHSTRELEDGGVDRCVLGPGRPAALAAHRRAGKMVCFSCNRFAPAAAQKWWKQCEMVEKRRLYWSCSCGKGTYCPPEAKAISKAMPSRPSSRLPPASVGARIDARPISPGAGKGGRKKKAAQKDEPPPAQGIQGPLR